jgi:hypothetical protein
MNLLDTASLVVTPNGYKASKLYSIIPSDGSGDMTFARTGDTATRVNSSGLIESVTANKPRLDYLGSTCPKLLLEPQRTNLVLQSQDISSASWTKEGTNTIVSNSAVAPDGTTTADSIQSANSSTYNNITQIITVSANSTYTFSVFVKKETTRTNFCGVSLYFLGTTGKIASVAFNEVAGTATNLTDINITPTSKVDDYGTYWRYSVTATDTGSNTLLIAYFYPTISTNGTSSGLGTGSARTIWGMQLEAGSYATSYIPTTTASVTRNVDSSTKSSISSLIGQTEGTMFIDLIYDANKIETGQVLIPLVLSQSTTSSAITLYKTGRVQATHFNSGTLTCNIDLSSYGLTNARHKIAFAYKQNDFILYIDGVLAGSDTSGTIGAQDSISLKDTTYPSIVNTNSVALWKTRLTNQELVTLTTI